MRLRIFDPFVALGKEPVKMTNTAGIGQMAQAHGLTRADDLAQCLRIKAIAQLVVEQDCAGALQHRFSLFA